MSLKRLKSAIVVLVASYLVLMSQVYAGDSAFAGTGKVTAIEITLDALLAGPIQPTLWRYEDRDHRLGLEQARDLLDKGQFEATPADFNDGYSASRYWYYFELKTHANSLNPLGSQELYIEIDLPLIDDLMLIQMMGESIDRVFDIGDRFPFYDRPVASTNFVLPVNLPTGYTVGFLAKVDTVGAARFPVKIWQKDRYLAAYAKSHMVNGLFFGFVFLLALYNCLIGIKIRDIGHVFYFLFFTSSGLFYAAYWGYGFQYLWPEAPYINEISIPVLSFTSLGLSHLFANTILELRRISPWLGRLVLWSGMLYLAMALASFGMPYLLMINLTAVATLVTVVLLSTGSVVSWRRGQNQARYFIFGGVAVLVGLTLFSLANKGVIPVNTFTLHGNQIGIVLQALFFSFALGDRINQTLREKRTIELKAKQELEQKNNQLNILLQEVRRGSELKDQFLATISHELRTPMNGLESSLEMLGEKINSPELLQPYSIAKYSAHNMTRTVDRVLELYELQTGKLVLQKSPVNLFALTAKALQSCAEEASRKNLRFQLDMNTLPQRYFVLDGPRFQTLLIQLVDNAIKFTHEGGVNVRLDWIASEDVESGSDQDRSVTHMLNVVVADTGIGIESGDQQLIFEKFRQVDGSFARKFGGLGIGLTLVNALLEKIGGRIALQSTLGAGTTFTLEMPVELGDRLPLTTSTSAISNHKGRVLIVEDNSVNQLMLATIVKKLGYETEIANDGQQAVEKTQAQMFDCILMDCQMPIMDGFNATLAIRNSISANNAIPIIAVTANAASSDRQRCYDVGMNDFVKKPINKDIVAEKICKWLSDGQLEPTQLIC